MQKIFLADITEMLDTCIRKVATLAEGEDMPSTGADRSMVVTRPSERRQAHDFLAAVDGQVGAVVTTDAPESHIALPPELSEIIGKVLEIMASGGTITIKSMPDELTTTMAAKELGVSRPTLMRMIRDDEIAAHKVGSHHRLKTNDVLTFKRTRLERQRRALAGLRDLEEQLDQF